MHVLMTHDVCYLCTVQRGQQTSVAQIIAPLEHVVTSERKEIYNIR